MGPAAAVAACLLVSVSYVTSLYAWGRSHAYGRQHPAVVARRCFSVAAVSALAWLPTAAFHAAAQVGLGWGFRSLAMGAAAWASAPVHA
jgi:hypothetical protein